MPYAVYKPVGLTPLQTILLLKKKHSYLLNEKISYAGRLDPMADGVLLLLIGEENKLRDNYLKLNKTYNFSFLLGTVSDSYDILGIPTGKTKILEKNSHLKQKLQTCANSFLGTINQSYPPYSSAVVQGKPLYYWTRKQLLHTISIPIASREIYSLNIKSVEYWSTATLTSFVLSRIALLQGDFRQKQISAAWRSYGFMTQHIHTVVTAEVSASSGTYVRGIVHDIGQKLE